MKYKGPFSSVILIISFFTAIRFVFSLSSLNNCILDVQYSSSSIYSTCTGGNWDGFLDSNCCESTFDEYLHALGKRINQTGKLFLNSSEQNGCLTSMKGMNRTVSSCGIEKLTSGKGGCSDYSVLDVSDNQGNELRKLGEDCKVLSSDGGSNATGCSACLRRWEEMRVAANSSVDLIAATDVCRFAVLVTLTSQRIEDETWILAVYKCLGEGRIALANEEGMKGKRQKLSSDLWILIGVIVGLILIIAVWIFSRKSRKAKVLKVKDASNDLVSEESSCHKISIKEVYSAINNLSASNFIGQGIAGKVYKGILSNGQHVAVKHIINEEQIETFFREVTSLSHVRHPNLVALLGHCKGEGECFLIYELCHKGNLSEWLFGKEKTLSWTQRLEIAIDCARGLWFLHTYPEGCIVHRDIKPANILLCANFQGKLSDFGLSKVIAIDQSYVSSEVRGTYGYVDPEYRKNNRVNSSGDVYSFGIVLLQLISGQRVINLDANKPMPLNKMAKMLSRGGNIIDFADPKFKGNFPDEAFELVLKLALTCTGMKQQRPSMEQVVGKLEQALDISTADESIVPQVALDVE